MERLRIYINMFRIFPTYICMRNSKDKEIIFNDFFRWKSILLRTVDSDIYFLGFLLLFKKEYINLLIYRLKRKNIILATITRLLWKPINTLYIETPEIGEGFFIQHGFATIITANSIGKNCSVNQQVTVGYNGNERPTILDNVQISAGAKVIGGVILNNNCTVGANAVVVHDVPEDAIVGGVPARVLKYKESQKNENA